MHTCDKCRKILANRHSLSRHKKTCPLHHNENGTSLHSSGDSVYAHPAGSKQYNKQWPENVINADISSRNEESEPMIKQIKLSADSDLPVPSSHSIPTEELGGIGVPPVAWTPKIKGLRRLDASNNLLLSRLLDARRL